MGSVSYSLVNGGSICTSHLHNACILIVLCYVKCIANAHGTAYVAVGL